MPDIDLYAESPELYDDLQRLRPDYVEALDVVTNLATKYAPGSDIRLLDLCCGTAASTLDFSKTRPLTTVELVDMNLTFLHKARSSGIDTKQITLINSDVRVYRPRREFNVVFSIFAYHHVPDADKQAYVDTITNALNPNGLLVLGEIFFHDKISEQAYYRDLLDSIPESEHTVDLERFLGQTANSSDFEFKVSKQFSDEQFARNGFELLEERKIWPQIEGEDGTYVQIYRQTATNHEK